MAIKRILVVDDDEDHRALVHLCLMKMAGWELVSAESGQQAIAMAEANRLDAILMDVMMPEMDGLTAVRHLKANPTTREIPVIFMTARHHSVAREEYQAVGGVGIIPKPIDPMWLGAQICALLRWGQEEQAAMA